jgi:phosphoribosylformimino-5-aminoimidazole carboxamide ribotide isomerase
MIVVPAIDVRGGKVVRLKQGRLQEETVYGADPAAAAQHWAAAGAARLHVVDLDAAIVGKPQFDIIARIIDAVSIPVEVGGGLRVLENAMRYVEHGAERVIFGTAAVAVAGWKEITRVDAADLAEQVKGWGVPRIQYTDVMRDGTLMGPNIAGIERLARQSGLRITAAGGISILEDLTRLKELEPVGVDEIVVGKALYEKRFTLAQAIQAVA